MSSDTAWALLQYPLPAGEQSEIAAGRTALFGLYLEGCWELGGAATFFYPVVLEDSTIPEHVLSCWKSILFLYFIFRKNTSDDICPIFFKTIFLPETLYFFLPDAFLSIPDGLGWSAGYNPQRTRLRILGSSLGFWCSACYLTKAASVLFQHTF